VWATITSALHSGQLLGGEALLTGRVRPPAIVDQHVATRFPAQFLEPALKRHDASLRPGIVLADAHEHADPPHPARLLGARRHRPGHGPAADKRDEGAPFHQGHLIGGTSSEDRRSSRGLWHSSGTSRTMIGGDSVGTDLALYQSALPAVLTQAIACRRCLSVMPYSLA
jgi:hypothetical protein